MDQQTERALREWLRPEPHVGVGRPVNREMIRELLAALDAAREQLALSEERYAGLRRALLQFVVVGVAEIGNDSDSAWWWHDRIAEALSKILEEYPPPSAAEDGEAR